MMSETFLIVFLSGAVNGALCYTLYSQLKKELHDLISRSSKTDESVQIEIKQDAEQKTTYAYDDHLLNNQTIKSDSLNAGIEQALRREVECQVMGQADVDAVDARAHIPEERSAQKSDGGDLDMCEVGGAPSSSFIGLGSWLFKRDKEQNVLSKSDRTESDS